MGTIMCESDVISPLRRRKKCDRPKQTNQAVSSKAMCGILPWFGFVRTLNDLLERGCFYLPMFHSIVIPRYKDIS